MAYWLQCINLVYLFWQIPAMINPKTDMHFNMNILYMFVSVVLMAVYGQVIRTFHQMPEDLIFQTQIQKVVSFLQQSQLYKQMVQHWLMAIYG